MDLFYIYYILHSIRSRLLPYSMSTFAEQTLSRYQQEYGYRGEFRADQDLPRWKSRFWRLVRAHNREKYFRACAANFIARGIIGNSFHVLKWYFFGGMTWIGLKHSVPFTLSHLLSLLHR